MVLLNSEKPEGQRHIVLSQDTFLVLELDFPLGPGDSLIFDALEIPLTRSVKYAADQQSRRLLSLRILLVDAATDMLMQIDEEIPEEEDGSTSASSLVDFQAESNIFDLHDGKAIVCFKLPCCFLDSTHRTGRYR